MLFNTVDFLVFFPLIVLGYLVIPRRLTSLWLLAASYYFYMCWNAKYIMLIVVSTLITYLSGIFLERLSSERGRKLVVAGSFAVNLGILFFFKYFDFFIATWNRVAAPLGIRILENPFSLLLPVGISFYTFQALSYTVDVYRRQIPAEKNVIRYALFVSFFPQLVAGPIERSGNLLHQLKEMEQRRIWNMEGIISGFSMMVFGMFQKMVIADRCALFVDAVYHNLFACGTMETVAAAITFSIQIYCDFAGYSAIAIGAAKIMGVDLMENFNCPYFARSIGEFWRRWHISLSTWFRDYLYIPLGGSRCSKVKRYRNLLVTFLVSGLWHGAAWTYVIWGALHGLYQILGDLLMPFREKLKQMMKVKTDVFSFKLGQMLITFSLTTFAWIFFRAGSLKEALYYINRMVTRWNPWVLFNEGLYRFGLDRKEVGILLVAIVVLLLIDFVRYKTNCNFGAYLMKQNVWFRFAVLIILIVCTLVYGEYGIDIDSSQFIYFAF